MIGLAVGGLGVLLCLAATIGLLVDRESRTSAWQRIADARRLNAERTDFNQQWEYELHNRFIELEALEERVRALHAQIAERVERVRQRERRADEREHALHVREQQLAARERALAERERRLSDESS